MFDCVCPSMQICTKRFFKIHFQMITFVPSVLFLHAPSQQGVNFSPAFACCNTLNRFADLRLKIQIDTWFRLVNKLCWSSRVRPQSLLAYFRHIAAWFLLSLLSSIAACMAWDRRRSLIRFFLKRCRPSRPRLWLLVVSVQIHDHSWLFSHLLY